MEFKGTKVFPKFEGGDNYSIDMVFDNEATISIDRRSRYTEQCNMSREEMEANALLISKAPEMLTALQEVIRLRDLIDYDESIVNESNIGEASALRQILNRIETLIKEATKL